MDNQHFLSAVVLTVLCVAPVWLLLVFKRLDELRRYIGSLASDSTRAGVIEPHLPRVWKQELAKLTPGSAKWKAYRASLDRVGQWDHEKDCPYGD